MQSPGKSKPRLSLRQVLTPPTLSLSLPSRSVHLSVCLSEMPRGFTSGVLVLPPPATALAGGEDDAARQPAHEDHPYRGAKAPHRRDRRCRCSRQSAASAHHRPVSRWHRTARISKRFGDACAKYRPPCARVRTSDRGSQGRKRSTLVGSPWILFGIGQTQHPCEAFDG